MSYDRVDADGYPLTMNDVWRELDARERRKKLEAEHEGHIPYASDRCPCKACDKARDERIAQMDDVS